MGNFIYNQRWKNTVSEINGKINDIGDSEIVLAKQDEKIVFKNASGNIVTVPSENQIEGMISGNVANFFDGAGYDEDAKVINFYHGRDVMATIDATPFIVDGMVDDVKVEDGKLVIVFNTASGKSNIEIPLTEIFDPSNYYTKTEVDTLLLNKTDKSVTGTNGTALIFNETDGGGAMFTHNDGTKSFVGVNDDGSGGIAAQIYAKNNSTNVGSRLDISTSAMYYTVGNDGAAARMVAENEIATKGNIDEAVGELYTKAEVDALIKAKETEIYNLTKLVGEIGGNVTYNYPNELGTSLTTLLKNNGTVKLGEDATISRFGPGTSDKNKVTLNLNGHNLTATAAGDYGAIMARGTQEITIGGKGTIDAGDGICIEANGTSILDPLATINLTGSTTVYHNNRSGGELIYCSVGIINITNGTFRNDGEDKKYMLNCKDANYRAGTAKIIVTGGKFYDFDPGNNEAEGPGTSFLAEGYHTEASTVVEEGVEHTIYTVKKD